MNLLIVDDNATNRKLLRVTLEAEGHTILEAADGLEALAVLACKTVDAIISDVLMPNMDGFRLCHEVRNSEQFHSLPFIIYTATYTLPDDVKLGQAVGADKYFLKPVTTETMLQVLDEIVGKTARRPAGTDDPPDETDVLQQYSQALIHKLEKKTAELQEAHDQMVELNQDLERRVRERTAELEVANRELTQTLSDVKELRGILPICGYCKKIRDDKDYWQSVEGYISRNTDAQFSHGICPDCFKKHVQPELDELKIGG